MYTELKTKKNVSFVLEIYGKLHECYMNNNKDLSVF